MSDRTHDCKEKKDIERRKNVRINRKSSNRNRCGSRTRTGYSSYIRKTGSKSSSNWPSGSFYGWDHWDVQESRRRGSIYTWSGCYRPGFHRKSNRRCKGKIRKYWYSGKQRRIKPSDAVRSGYTGSVGFSYECKLTWCILHGSGSGSGYESAGKRTYHFHK